jgi:hypothetical protein
MPCRIEPEQDSPKLLAQLLHHRQRAVDPVHLQKASISPDAEFSVLDWIADVIFIVVPLRRVLVWS